MLTKLPTWVIAGGVVGVVYAGGLTDKQVQEKCGNFPVGMAQVCGLIQAPQSASTIFWTGLVGGSGSGALLWFLVKSGKLNSRNIAYLTTAASVGMAIYSMAGGKIPKASATNTSTASTEGRGSLVTSNQRKAILDTISFAEGTYGDKGVKYNILFGGKEFTSFADHPKVDQGFTDTNGKRNSTDVAGAFQFLSTTFDGLKKAHPDKVPDFSPTSQDNGAILLIQRRNALGLIDKGEAKATIFALCQEWASMPCGENNVGAYPQRVKTIQVLTDFYNKRLKEYGG